MLASLAVFLQITKPSAVFVRVLIMLHHHGNGAGQRIEPFRKAAKSTSPSPGTASSIKVVMAGRFSRASLM